MLDRTGADPRHAPQPENTYLALHDREPVDIAGTTATARVCDSLAAFGGDPDRDDFDTREIWDGEEAQLALCQAITIIVRGITLDGTQLQDEREPLLWGFVNKPDTSPPGAVLSDLEPSRVYFSMPYPRTGILPFTVWNPPERPRVCFLVLSVVLTNAAPNVIFAA